MAKIAVVVKRTVDDMIETIEKRSRLIERQGSRTEREVGAVVCGLVRAVERRAQEERRRAEEEAKARRAVARCVDCLMTAVGHDISPNPYNPHCGTRD